MTSIHKNTARRFLVFSFVAAILLAPVIASADILKFESTDIKVADVGGKFVNDVWVWSPDDPAAYEISYKGIFYVEQITPGYNWVGQSNLAFWGKVVDWDITLTAVGGHGGGYDAPFPPGGWGFNDDQNLHYTKANSFMRAANGSTDYWPLEVLNAGSFYPGYEYYLGGMPWIYPDGSQAAVAAGQNVAGSLIHVGSQIWIIGQGSSGNSITLYGPHVNVPYNVPEPATLILCGLGVLGLTAVRTRFKR